MSADILETMLAQIGGPPRLDDLIRLRETAVLAIKTFHNQAEHALTQKRFAELSLRDINEQIKRHYGVVP